MTSMIVRRVVSVGLAALVAVGLGVTPAAAAELTVVGSLDSVTVASDGSIRVAGWALANGGYVSVHVYDTGPTRTVGTDLGVPQLARPDVEAAFGQSRVGFNRPLVIAEQGAHRVCAYGVGDRPGAKAVTLLGCREVSTGRAPVGFIDAIPAQSFRGLPVQVRGWAYDPDQPQTPLEIHAYVSPWIGLSDGSVLPLAPVKRPDVAAAFSGAGSAQGFDASISLAHFVNLGTQSTWEYYPGKHSICLFAIGLGLGGNTLLGCRDVDVVPPVRASLDEVSAPAIGAVAARGWSYLGYRPSETTLNTLRVDSLPKYTGGYSWSSAEFAADQPRADVGRAIPGAGSNHGYSSGQEGLLPGPYSVCVSTRSYPGVVFGNDVLGLSQCRDVIVPNAFGVIDSVVIGQAGPGTATVRGWAIDPTHLADTVALTTALRPAGSGSSEFSTAPMRATALDRPDVNAAFGVTGKHGYEMVVFVPEWFSGTAVACVQPTAFAPGVACRAPFATMSVQIG